MRTLTIEAASQESARALQNALSSFDAELISEKDGWRVRVPVGQGKTVGLLDAIDQHVNSQGSGSAWIRMEGRS